MLEKSVAGGRYLLIWWLAGEPRCEVFKIIWTKFHTPILFNMVAGYKDIAPLGMLGISSAGCPRGVLQEDGLRRMRAHPNWEPVAACQPGEF